MVNQNEFGYCADNCPAQNAQTNNNYGNTNNNYGNTNNNHGSTNNNNGNSNNNYGNYNPSNNPSNLWMHNYLQFLNYALYLGI